MRSSGPSENVGELHAPRQLHMCMLLQSRRTPALPHLATVHVPYRVFAAESRLV